MAARTPTVDSNATTVTTPTSPFARAVDEYIKSRPKKSKTPGFLSDLKKRREAGETLDQNAVKLEMVQLEKNAADRKSAQIVRKTLNPVIRCLSDYSSIVDVLVQADPMPTALIWGALKAVIQASTRFLELYEKIKDQLTAMSDHIDTLILYEEFFGHSSTMQELLQASYIHILRFWRRVEKECSRFVTNRLARATFSFSTSKLTGIVADIEKVADRMGLLAPAVEARLSRGEREDAAEERRLAGLAREEQTALFEMTANELKIRNEERKKTRKQEVGKWLLNGALEINESNHRHQEHNLSLRSSGTCAWLIKSGDFLDWLDASNGSTKLRVQAAPGSGKSVLTAYAIEQTRERASDTAAVCYQYYTFDEEFTSLQVFRSLAEQLANRLWEQTEDMPEEIHDITLKSTTSSKSEDVKTVLRMLLRQMSETFIFLDGLDEECDNGRRWGHLGQVLDFFLDITKESDYKVKLWCSCQPRTCMENRIQNFSTIEVNHKLNTHDIKSYLNARIPELDDLELDTGYRNLVLEDLSTKADGCFLWASLMLSSIVSSTSLQEIHEHISAGLPHDYEKYYLEKMKSIQQSDRKLVSVLLACIVYAKRPLRLDELCEATAAIATESGKDINKSAKLFKSKVLSLCQPLVMVQERNTKHGSVSTCSLAHATVRSFLLKHIDILNDDARENSISPRIMGDVCLTYLMQPRYNALLRKEGGDFRDKRDENILDHHLLVYAAKYWDKHLDQVDYSLELCSRVTSFLKSKQYFTCLQVQSLLVGGQFSFWWSADHLWLGPHIKRVFPSWFQVHCDDNMENAYRLFVSDWGNYLDQSACVDGSNPGEIDRCFFGALGHKNFLSLGPSRYTSFLLDSREDSAEQGPIRYFDAINTEATEMLVLSLKELRKDMEELEATCETWDVSGVKPVLSKTQVLRTPNEAIWALYDHPAIKQAAGRPSPVAFSSDLNSLRIGLRIFFRGDDGYFQATEGLNPDESYIDELSSCAGHIAVTSRRNMSYEDIYQPNEAPDQQAEDLGEALARQMHLLDATSKAELATASTASKATSGQSIESDSESQTASSQTSMSDEQEPDNEYLKSLPLVLESLASLKDQLTRKTELALAKQLDDDELFEADTESDGNSAQTDWSEDSREFDDDDLEDEDEWNDWGNDMTFEELKDDADERSGKESESETEDSDEAPEFNEDDLEHTDEWHSSDEEELSVQDEFEIDPGSEAESDDTGSVESQYAVSNSSDGSNSDEDDSDVEQARHLDALIHGRTGKSEAARKTTIEVYRLENSQGSSRLAFHFTRFIKGGIFNSPPAFHPSFPLLVWPLGDGEILFADYEKNTYFTRFLCCSRYKSCQVFVKTHFSASGEHVHFAALEASERDPKIGAGLDLNLQITTHRLSIRKGTRGLPTLIFKTNLDLGHCQTLQVSNLPYTFHWTDMDVFVSTRGQELDVVRIPLFKDPENETQRTCFIQNRIFLPRTTEERTVYFSPPANVTVPPAASTTSTSTLGVSPNPAHIFPTSQSSQSKKPKVKVDKSTHATIIIGSHSSIPSQGLIVPRYQVSPPTGVYLHERNDLGAWTCKPVPKEEKGKRKRIEGGRLQGRFERFDKSEDCDIVPFLY